MMHRFIRDEEGWGTIAALFLCLGVIVLCGVMIDVTNAFRVHKQMQVASDAAALAAATSLDDTETAISRATVTTARNLPAATNGTAIGAGDYEFGRYDAVTGFGPATGKDINAVRVTARREEGRANRLPSYISHMVGFPDWTIGASAIALGERGPSAPGCENATIATRGYMQTGGGNTWMGPVCLHGERGVHTGGADWYDTPVRISAPDADTITINTVKRGSYGADDYNLLKVERSMQFPLLDSLPGRFADIEAELSGYATGDIYQGSTLPEIYRGKPVQRLDPSWVVMKRPGTLEPWENWGGIVELNSDTIYVANGSVSLEGNVDGDGIVIIAEGSINIGGGANLGFEDVFLFARQRLGGSGAVRWGSEEHYCDAGRFNSYLLSLDTLALGGAVGAYGLVGAAPRFEPGGAFRNAGGLYIETEQDVPLGGAYNVTGCGEALQSDLPIFRPGSGDAAAGTHARLVR